MEQDEQRQDDAAPQRVRAQHAEVPPCEVDALSARVLAGWAHG